MNKLLLTAICISLASATLAQKKQVTFTVKKMADEQSEVEIIEMPEESTEAEQLVLVVVEEMPVFPGGEQAMRRYIAENVEYPDEARGNNIQGRVFVQFNVNEQGKVVGAKVVRSVAPSLDSAALKVVRSFPDWTPGKQRGKPVKVSFTVPINFQLAK